MTMSIRFVILLNLCSQSIRRKSHSIRVCVCFRHRKKHNKFPFNKNYFLDQASGQFNDNIFVSSFDFFKSSTETFIQGHLDSLKDNEKKSDYAFRLNINMGQAKKEYERTVYTIFQLIGDFGGLNDGLMFLVGFFFNFYNSTLFQSALAHNLYFLQDITHT